MPLRRALDPKLEPGVFLAAAALMVPFLAVGVASPKLLDRAAGAALSHLTGAWDWLYLRSVTAFVVACIAIAASPLGRIRLGRDDEPPEFTRGSWFAMLFSAGMGIGLAFWSVGEPLTHFLKPPTGVARSAAASDLAFEIFNFHWGIHAWATYVVVGLALAFFRYRREEPALISRCLAPVLGRASRGAVGAVVDVLAIWATILGVVTSLGLGAMQIASGLSLTAGVAEGEALTLAVVGVSTVAFIVSALTGVERGIKLLSNITVGLMLLLLAFFLAFGPTASLLRSFGVGLLGYARDLVPLSFRLALFDNREWTRTWTVFYWAWWIAWAPFVGAFVARISRGRTVREFVVVVMVAPALFSFAFATALGGTAIHIDLFGGGHIGDLVTTRVEAALFETLRHLPYFPVMAAVTNVLVALFFISSADSATYIASSFSTGGSLTVSRRLIVFWGLVLGGTAAVLLHAGGLQALQTASILGSFPFLIVMWLLLAATVKELIQEARASANQNRGGI